MTRPIAAGTALVRRRPSDRPGGRLEIEIVARESGLHPELVRRFLALGLLDGYDNAVLSPLYWRGAAARLARAARLRRDLGLNYAGAILACELLERIETLEARLRRYEAPPEDTDFGR
jgi:hypothetical protein